MNFCDRLCDNLISDHIVLAVKNKETTKKLCRFRDLTLNTAVVELLKQCLKAMIKVIHSNPYLKYKVIENAFIIIFESYSNLPSSCLLFC